MDPDQIPLLLCRQLQAEIAAPLIDAYARVLGRDKAMEIAAGAIAEQARKAGKTAAARTGGHSLEHLWHVVATIWARNGALRIKLLKLDSEHLDFNVTRCAYVDMYRRLGLDQVGKILSCSRDRAFAKGFNPAISMKRSRTLMAGNSFCDFRFSLPCHPD